MSPDRPEERSFQGNFQRIHRKIKKIKVLSVNFIWTFMDYSYLRNPFLKRV